MDSSTRLTLIQHLLTGTTADAVDYRRVATPEAQDKLVEEYKQLIGQVFGVDAQYVEAPEIVE